MKSNYLFPNSYKKLGLYVLIPSIIFGIIMSIYDIEPDFLDLKVFAILGGNGMSFTSKNFTIIENNILNEIVGILIIVSSILVGFSKEKDEDELIAKIRLESLVWAIYANYIVLLFAFIFVYDLSFLSVMIYNMFTILIFFIIRFNWLVCKLRKSYSYDK